MGAGRFVGRVGGLAVALGVGAAVSLGSGTAWADDGTGGGAESGGTSSTSGGSAGGGGASSGSSAPGSSESGATASEPTSPSSVEAGGESKSEVKTASSGSSHKRKSAGSKAAKKDATEAPKLSVTARPVRQDNDDDTASSAPRSVKPAAVAVSAPATTSVAQVPEAAPAAAVVTGSVRAVSGAVVDASLVGGVPAGPLVNSPVLWAVAAASRREFAGGGGTAAKSAAVVLTGEPATALAAAAPAQTANANPVIQTPIPSITDSSTGVVSGFGTATDADGNTLKYTATASTGKVVVTATTTGFTFKYTPTAAARHAATATTNPVTSDTINFTVTDGKGGVDTKALTVDIVPANTAPTATYTVGKPNPATGSVTVTVKSTDKDKDKLTYTVSAPAGSGTVTADATGKFIYTPYAVVQLLAGPNTTDSFTFSVSDGHGGSFADTVTVPIAQNQAPVNGAPPILKTNPTTGAVTGTIKATDPDKGNTISYSAESTTKGTVTLNPKTGAFTYTPNQAARQAVADGVAGADFDVVNVIVTDSKGAPITQSFAVTITPNNAPINPAFTITNSTSSGVVTGKVTATDPDIDALTYSAAASASGGKVKINAKTGVFTYTPTAAARHAAGLTVNPITSDSFTVTITDAKGASITTPVAVTVVPANTAPTATVTVGKPEATSGLVTGTVKGTDKDKDSLTYSAPATTSKGTVTIDATTGAFTYTPTPAARHDAAGTVAADKTDAFTVTITDGHNGGTTTKDVLVTVSPTNTAPTGGAATGITVGANGVVTGTLSATDANGDPLTYTAPAKTAKGTITMTGSTFTYTPTDAARIKANATNVTAADKADAFTVTASDGHTGTTTFTVNVTVAPKGLSVTGTVTVNGENVDAVMSKDGTRAIIATVTGDSTSGYTTSFTVINTTTGAKVGTAVQVTGQEGWITFSDNASRAMVATAVDEADGSQSTRLAVINAGTGVQLGTTLTLAGYSYVDDALQYNADQSRAILAIDGKNASGDDVTRVTVVNLTTGAQAGVTRAFLGFQDGDDGSLLPPVSVDLNNDGSRIVVTTIGELDDSFDRANAVAIIETAGGTLLSSTAFTGNAFNPVQISDDGTRGVLAYTPAGAAQQDQVTKVVLLNLTTGAQFGSTLSVAGQGAAQLSHNGSTLVVNSGVYDDGTKEFSTQISVYNAATGVQLGTTVGVDDTTTILPALFNGADTRAVVTGYVTTVNDITGVRVIVIDTATGAQVGTAVTIDGWPIGFNAGTADLPLPIQLVLNDTRVVVTTVASVGTTTNYAVINAVTGTQVGTTLNLTGTVVFNVEDTDTYLTPVFNDDDSRAYLTTVTGSANGGYTTRISLLNTGTGAQVGNTIVLAGAPATYIGDVNVVGGGNRAAYFTNVLDSKGNYTTRVAIVNTDNGSQLGATRSFTGTYGAYVQISDDNRVTVLADTDTTSKLSIYNADTGAQIGKTLSYSGSTWTWVTLTTDPNRALAFTVSGNTTKVTAIDLTTATTIGPTLTLAGGLYYVYRDDANGRAVVTVQTGDATTGFVTKVISVQIKA
ncbi:MAG: cadherin-like domain-containing protein [Mycolicibacterium cosmeticum]|nr:cadherin-like domain-containing protein [Mycolicibacterium cosmeticum]